MNRAAKLMNTRSAAWLGLAIRLALGLLLVLAGHAKLMAFDWWRDLVSRMDLFGDALAGPLSGILPGIELVVGLALVSGLFTRPAAYLAAVLHLGFGTILVVLILRDAPAHCGCFGPGSEYPVDLLHVLGNLGQLLTALLLAILPEHAFSLDRFRSRR